MSLRNDRPLTYAYRLATHRRYAETPEIKEASAKAWIGYIGQFAGTQRNAMTRVYYEALHGMLVEDRRTRGKR
jgi:hypothetical protein